MDVFEVALAKLDLGKEEWLVDSDASRYVYGDQNVLYSLDLALGTSSIKIARNETLSVQGISFVNLGSNAEINKQSYVMSSYFVLGLTRNLLFVGKIAYEG